MSKGVHPKDAIERKEIFYKNHYFDNEIVERLLHRYLRGACTDVHLRDEIMIHASELIVQLIKAHNLAQIYPGKDDSSMMDLFQTAWIQIESALYKYEALPYCAKCYNNMRPNESLLSEEYIFEAEIVKRIKRCPNCKVQLTETSIYYKGKSRLFNLWCVNPNTKVITKNGILPISDVVDNISLMVHGIDKMVEVNGGIRKIKQDTLIINSMYNYPIEGSTEHCLMRLNDNGPDWAKLKDLKVGDLVAMQCGQHIFGNNDDISDIKLVTDEWKHPNVITNDMAYFFGLYISEGSYGNNMLNIYNVDKEVIDFLSRFNGLKFKHQDINCGNYTCSKSFNEFMDKIGFSECHTAQNKKIPDRLLRMSKDNIHNLLSGLFDGDGHSSSFNGEVGFTSTSLELINQIRSILLNIGIVSKLYVDPREIREFIKKDGRSYISNLTGAYMIRLPTADSLRFYDRIGFRINRKQENITSLPIPHEYIYSLKDKFIKLYKKYGSVGHYNQIRKLIKPGYVGKLFKVRQYLEYWSNFSEDIDYKFLKERIDENLKFKNRVIWLPIIKIEKSESELCDIEVNSDDHGYIANGFVSHNSQVARTVILAYIKKENRDRKNSNMFKTHVENKPIGPSKIISRFYDEAYELCKFNDEHLQILDALMKLHNKDERAHEGLIAKLMQETNLSRSSIVCFFRIIRLRCHDFSDSPVNEINNTAKNILGNGEPDDFEDR